MNAAEKFSKTIEAIEFYVSSEDYSASDIGQLVAKNNGLSIRDMSSVFSFLVDKTLNAYITERKLTAAYQFLVTSDERGKSSAVGIAGYSDQPTFTKAFKRMFGMTPGQAQRKRDMSRISPPLSWEQLSGNLISVNSSLGDAEVVEELIFGVSESSYNKVTKALDLEAFYGFTKMFSQYAFELSERTGHSLEDCFRYVDSLREFGGDFDEGYIDGLTPIERLHEDGDDERYQLLFFTRGISVDMSWTLIHEYHIKPEELLSSDPNMLKYFPGFEEGVEISFSYFVRAYNAYVEHFDIEETEEAFNDYLDYVLSGTPIEEALTDIYGQAEIEQDLTRGEFPYDDINIDEDLTEFERSSALDALAEEEMRWHGTRIDDDLTYDPDNVVYDQYDQEDEEW